MIIPIIILGLGSIFAGVSFKEIFIGSESVNVLWRESIFFLNPLSLDHPPYWVIYLTPILVIISIPISYYLFISNTKFLNEVVEGNKPLYNFLRNKWYFDELYEVIFVKSSKKIGLFFWKSVDIKFIDKYGPDGLSNLIKNFSLRAVKFQSGYIYQYAFIMLLGFSLLLTILILK